MVEIESNQNFDLSSYIAGGFMVFFYFLLIIYPYYSSNKKGKLNDDFMLSTAFEHADKQGETLFIQSFIVTAMWFLSYKGVLFNNDNRLTIPIALWVFGFTMVLLLWIPAPSVSEFKMNAFHSYRHYIIAIFAMAAGQALMTILYVIYKERKEYENEDSFKALRGLFITVTIISCLLIVVFLGKVFLKRKWENSVARLELLHMAVVLGGLICYIVMPALPLPVIEQNTGEVVDITIVPPTEPIEPTTNEITE